MTDSSSPVLHLLIQQLSAFFPIVPRSYKCPGSSRDPSKVGMRSRTGCLTCRARKLKCDEQYQAVGGEGKQKVQCAHCRKASRECRPSEGIVFRHQQNASMNNKTTDEESGRATLRGFYNYKNTFDKDSVWLEIPKNVIFVDNTDPRADELEASILASDPNKHEALANEWYHQNSGSAPDDTAPGLNALSTAAAAQHSYVFQHSSAASPETPGLRLTGINDMRVPLTSTTPHPTNKVLNTLSPTSPPISTTSSSNNNINFLLNPSTSSSPSVDSSLPTSIGHRRESSSYQARRRSALSNVRLDAKVETDHEVSFLLRHFAENPGYWMDLFDLDFYFSSLVPVKALSNPLLKYAACAYAAKQLNRVRGAKAIMGGNCSKQASMELWPDAANVDWEWHSAKYYDKAIQLLMRELQHDAGSPGPGPLSTPEAFGQWQATELCDNAERARKRRRRSSNSRFSSSHSDEVLAATAILSVYEFLDATGPAWNGHLSGVKSLLDIAEIGMMPLEQESCSPAEGILPRKRPGLSRARRATFWNFARQDYISAFINEGQTRLNPEDLLLWTDAGLQLDSNGFVVPSNTDAETTMKEDMISNALIWLLSKIVNFIDAGDQIPSSGFAGGSSEQQQGPIGISQNTLLERWYRLHSELDAWYRGLPDTFQPCARLEPARLPHGIDDGDCPFAEVWYSMPMCASTMQHYHMARILLLINKPHESTARRTTVTNRLESYRAIESEIRLHSYEVCNISMSRMDASSRIHSVQPLFVTGQCLTEPRERRTILSLLRGIEADTGWATEYRVKQLLREWEWE